MEEAEVRRSLGFDGTAYAYQSGATQAVLLAASSVPPLVRAAIDRRLTSLGRSPEAMAEGLVLLLALAGGRCAHGGETLDRFSESRP